jgi:molybdopterin converting factor small subunit
MAEGPGIVTIRLPQALAGDAGGARELLVEVGPSTSLREVLDDLGQSAPAARRRILDETGAIRRFVDVFVDEDECRTLEGLDTRVRPGTVVYVIPSVAGG